MAHVLPVIRNNFVGKSAKNQKIWTVVDTLKPIIILSSVFGANRIYLIPSTSVNVQRLCQMYFACIIIFYALKGFIVDSIWITEELLVTRINTYLTVLEYVFITLTSSLLNKHDCRRFIQIIEEIDKEIGWDEDSKKIADKSLSVKIIFYILPSVLLGILWVCYSLSWNASWFTAMMDMTRVLPNIQIIYYTTLLQVVQQRLTLIRNHVRRYVREFDERKSMTTVSCNVTIEEMYNIYQRLYTSAKILEKLMNSQLVFTLAAALLRLVLTIFVSVNIFATLVKRNHILILLIVLSYVVYFPTLMAPCCKCESTNYEVGRIRFLLADRLACRNIGKRERQQLKNLLLLTSDQEFRYVLCHLISLDMTLPYKFFALLVSYTVIALQFFKLRVE